MINTKIITHLNIKTIYCILKRHMHFCRDSISSATYTFFKTVITNDVLNNTTTASKKAAITAITHYTQNTLFDVSTQHRVSIAKNIIRQKWHINEIKEVYFTKYPEHKDIIVFPELNTMVENFKEGTVLTADSRLFGELPVLRALTDAFLPTICKVFTTFDYVSQKLPNQKQSNVDYNLKIWDIFNNPKIIYGDAKSGVNIIRNMTRGHYGIVETQNKCEIKFTPVYPLITSDYNRLRLRNIEHTVGQNTEMLKALEKAHEILMKQIED